MPNLLDIAVLFVNEANPLGFVVIMSFLFLYFGTPGDIKNQLDDELPEKYDKWEQYFLEKKVVLEETVMNEDGDLITTYKSNKKMVKRLDSMKTDDRRGGMQRKASRFNFGDVVSSDDEEAALPTPSTSKRGLSRVRTSGLGAHVNSDDEEENGDVELVASGPGMRGISRQMSMAPAAAGRGLGRQMSMAPAAAGRGLGRQMSMAPPAAGRGLDRQMSMAPAAAVGRGLGRQVSMAPPDMVHNPPMRVPSGVLGGAEMIMNPMMRASTMGPDGVPLAPMSLGRQGTMSMNPLLRHVTIGPDGLPINLTRQGTMDASARAKVPTKQGVVPTAREALKRKQTMEALKEEQQKTTLEKKPTMTAAPKATAPAKKGGAFAKASITVK